MLRQGLLLGGLLLLMVSTYAADRPETDRPALAQLSRTFAEKLEARRTAVYYDLLQSGAVAQRRLNESREIQLMFMDDRGQPRFLATTNLTAARTISTDDVWPGGSVGLSLTGSTTVLGELGVWDGGGVLTSHREFDGRVTQMDSPAATHYHSTHVAGTMMAEGQTPQAKGMSYQANLAAYDWDNDESEMAAAAAAGMNISNHSYGFVVGWRYDADWYWYGDIDISPTEDYGFGYYGSYVQDIDQIAYDAPYYLICKSAGNDRNDTGPGAGGGHYVWDGDWVWSTDTRDEDCSPGGYDCVGWKGNAKNILTVGAVGDLAGGYSTPGGVSMSSFSAWGPTDDGRIKPDIVANGVSLYSCLDGGDSDYGSLSGTSMSTPNASGSINLLVRHYEMTHGDETPLAATVKALVIHTADEAGPNAGPDYMFGWGLMNTTSAAELISDDVTSPGLIEEASLANGETDEYSIASDGLKPLRVTVVWTDPPGTPPAPAVDPTALMLVDDLDLRLENVSTSTVHYPYVLDPANPADAATAGDNYRDNVEQIHLATPAAGVYRVTVGHKGTLASPRPYSIVFSDPPVACVDSDGDGYGDPGAPGNTCPDDNCPNNYNPGQEDSDDDGVGNACDVCPGFDDTADGDGDGVPDGCDICAGFDDTADGDDDGVPDGCDVCPGFDDTADGDGDGVPDGCDICAGFDDSTDGDGDGVPDGCDVCLGFDDTADDDGDGVPDGCDVCPGFDDTADGDGDGVPDGCDICAGFDDAADGDGDGVPNGCDICPGFDDGADVDTDEVPDGCDNCPDDHNPLQEDTDGDQIGDVCETCCRDRVGDANGLGGDEPTIGDVSIMIDAKFITGTCDGVLDCLPEADINQSGGPDPTCGDITIGDISSLIDYLFIAGPSLGLADCL